MLRLIQSIPSPKAEPFKLWLAQVGAERLEEIEDPEKALEEWKERAIRSYMARGYSLAWAKARVDSILARKRVTGEWAVRGIKLEEYAILTDRMHMGTFGLNIQEHMELKGYPVIKRGKRTVHKGDLREGMTILESAVITFAENVSAGLHVERDSHGFTQIARDVDDAAELARKNRVELERLTGQPVVSSVNMTIEKDGGLWSLLPPPDDA
jgi:DNA-damage-inducible protein D